MSYTFYFPAEEQSGLKPGDAKAAAKAAPSIDVHTQSSPSPRIFGLTWWRSKLRLQSRKESAS